MNKIILIIIFCFPILLIGQDPSPEYYSICRKADSLYWEKDYMNSALLYSKALRTSGNKGFISDRFKAARCYAKANMPDSALNYLERIGDKGLIENVPTLISEPDLNSLHELKRWNILVDHVKNFVIHKNASPNGDHPATISVKNNLSEPVYVYWIDFYGKEVFYFDLEPKQEKEQETYTGHVWIVKTSKSFKQIKEFKVKFNLDKILIE
jgi:hypothetical protein